MDIIGVTGVAGVILFASVMFISGVTDVNGIIGDSGIKDGDSDVTGVAGISDRVGCCR